GRLRERGRRGRAGRGAGPVALQANRRVGRAGADRAVPAGVGGADRGGRGERGVPAAGTGLAVRQRERQRPVADRVAEVGDRQGSGEATSRGRGLPRVEVLVRDRAAGGGGRSGPFHDGRAGEHQRANGGGGQQAFAV